MRYLLAWSVHLRNLTVTAFIIGFLYRTDVNGRFLEKVAAVVGLKQKQLGLDLVQVLYYEVMAELVATWKLSAAIQAALMLEIVYLDFVHAFKMLTVALLCIP